MIINFVSSSIVYQYLIDNQINNLFQYNYAIKTVIDR